MNKKIIEIAVGWGPGYIWLHTTLNVHDHTTWFWKCLGTAFGHFLLGSYNFMGTALGSCVKWPLNDRLAGGLWPKPYDVFIYIYSNIGHYKGNVQVAWDVLALKTGFDSYECLCCNEALIPTLCKPQAKSPASCIMKYPFERVPKRLQWSFKDFKQSIGMFTKVVFADCAIILVCSVLFVS